MIVHLSLICLIGSFNWLLAESCTNLTFPNGALANYKASTKSGDSAIVTCDAGYASYNQLIECGDDGTWAPTPICHLVAVKFSETSMIKYVFPIPYDSVDSTISFSFSSPPDKLSGMLLRLASKKLDDGSRDTLTVEIVGGFLATTMQLSSLGQSIIGFCHDDKPLNDNSLHNIILKRDMASLNMIIDNRSIKCEYPSGEMATVQFSSLKSVLVGHLQPEWGPDYGFTGCISNLLIDGLAPLVLADLKLNAGKDMPISTTNIEIVETCGVPFVGPSTQLPPESTTIDPATEKGEVAEEEGGGKDSTTLIIILVTIIILILLVILIGVVCKRYYNNKGTYKIDERAGRSDAQENPEQEYFI